MRAPAKSRVRLALLLEPNQSALALARDTKAREQHARGGQIRHEITNSQMVEAVHRVRNVVPTILSPLVRWRFYRNLPVPLSETEILEIAR